MDPPGALARSEAAEPGPLPAAWLDRRFRAHPGLGFLSREQAIRRGLSCPERLPGGEATYGCVYPHGPAPPDHRPLSADAALLFLTLQRAAEVPAWFRSRPGRKTEALVSGLVLDGVLEVEHQGAYVGGQAARGVLFGGAGGAPRGHLADLSLDALRYADSLVDLAVPALTRRLYDFGRRPITAARKAAYHLAAGDPLGGPFEAARSALEQHWVRSPAVDAAWTMWRPRRVTDDPDPVRFKLYISPGVDDVGKAFEAAAEVLGLSPGVRGLKAGRGLAGHTRSDKLVAYFSRRDDLQEAGLRLHPRLQGCAVHGVPFSAELTRDGLLSWGADPPRDLGGAGSWRLWLAGRLASHFVAERLGSGPGPVWQQVLDRIRLDGVDPQTWMPDPGLWSATPPVAA